MHRNISVNEDTLLRVLPISVTRHLSNLLDPNDVWELLLENIPLHIDQQNSPPRYTAQNAQNIQDRSRRTGKSPTRIILEDWGMQNPRIKHLMKALLDSDLVAAADYVAVDVLKGTSVKQPNCIGDNRGIYLEGQISTESNQNNFDTPSTKTTKCCEKRISPSLPQEHSESRSSSIDNSSRRSSSDVSELSTIEMRSYHYSVSSSAQQSSFPVGQPNPFAEAFTKKATENDDTPAVLKQLLNLHIAGNDEAFSKIEYSLLEEITNNFDDCSLSDGGRLLGSGGFGSVYLGIEGKEHVAVKRLYDTTNDLVKQYETELNVLKKFHHENLLPLLGYCCQPKLCIICEYMVNGSVEDRLARKDQTKPLSVDRRLVIAKGTAHGINYLNSNKVVHRDIKSANVLLDRDFIPKVGDFATARPGPMGNNTTAVLTAVVMGTSAYQAPEARLHDISAKLDSFGFGVILLELLTSLPAFDMNREDRDLKSHILENFEEEDFNKCVDKEAGQWSPDLVSNIYHIAMECLRERKKKRVTVGEILPRLEELKNC
ncbi:interleukin-1 receptor-associated kinase 4 isoform X1 [Octopus sinensis]|uniref:non-specific serine/threonine protein kinase n=1 Tax=Octopus sinensis TaxID=2607531 RepID=A0A6P7TKH7_9MOLL|nr:interleukin-1 receptor-associated kinase 4 isoform X1 [Octopus sinensis]XP_029650576.1 interleukin-1 receptor-associated kinase 4 isoform X1 [Octopus sinensis]